VIHHRYFYKQPFHGNCDERVDRVTARNYVKDRNAVSYRLLFLLELPVNPSICLYYFARHVIHCTVEVRAQAHFARNTAAQFARNTLARWHWQQRSLWKRRALVRMESGYFRRNGST
jgi:hypothetical protein